MIKLRMISLDNDDDDEDAGVGAMRQVRIKTWTTLRPYIPEIS